MANGRKLDAGRGLRDGAIVAAVVAFEGLLTWALLFVAGLDSLNRGDSQWWQVAKLLFHGMVWSQWTGGLGLGALTGLMFAAGVGRRRLTMPLLVASLAVGAVVPVGFLILAGMLDDYERTHGCAAADDAVGGVRDRRTLGTWAGDSAVSVDTLMQPQV